MAHGDRLQHGDHRLVLRRLRSAPGLDDPTAISGPPVALRAVADTVANARSTQGVAQPWAALGLKSDEYAKIIEILGRRPTSSELAMYSVMWSEHCSYKSSKVHLRRFGELPPETPIGKLLAGIGENAGVIDVGQGYAVTFKIESHNHPSYVEPYQGAATGVGGIVRDILAMGARPIGGDGPPAFRTAARAGHRPSASGGRRWGRRLRQLSRPAEHRRRGGLRPQLPRQPAGQRALRRRPATRGPPSGQGNRGRQPGDLVRRLDRRGRHRRGQRAGLRDVRG